MKVEIYSDVACPWCYIGERRFARALEEFRADEDVEVVYRPYQLDPRAPTPGVPMLDYLERRFGPGAAGMVDRVVETARAEGLTMDYEHGIAANTLDAHRLMNLAWVEQGPQAQRQLAERLFEAHFADGADIADPDVLVDLATSVGMDADRVRDYLVTGHGRDEVRQEIERAQRLGISAVPTFVFDGRYAVQGAQSAAVFRQALETVAAGVSG
ncbi:MAG: DsbA family oxidoreductase [Gemmatimonadota bacterium]